jgi:hypothetical protein
LNEYGTGPLFFDISLFACPIFNKRIRRDFVYLLVSFNFLALIVLPLGDLLLNLKKTTLGANFTEIVTKKDLRIPNGNVTISRRSGRK